MKRGRLFKAVSMILIVTILAASVSVIGFAKGNTVEVYALKPSVSPEECTCICHGKVGQNIYDDMLDGHKPEEKILISPLAVLAGAFGQGYGLLLKQIEWFFTFQWHCKCGKPHFDGLKDYSQS